MDEPSTSIRRLAGVEALLYLAPMTERPGLSPHGAFEDPTAPADVRPRESIELRAIAFHAA